MWSRLVVNILVYLVLPFSAIIEIWYCASLIESTYVGIGTLSDSGSTGFGSILGIVIFSLLSLVLIAYVVVGGFGSVVATDKFQVFLASISLLTLLFGLLVLVLQSDSFDVRSMLLGISGSLEQTSSLWLVFFVVGGLSLNGLWQFVEPQQWHRAYSAESFEAYKSSLPRAALVTSLMWLLPAVLGAITAGIGFDTSDRVQVQRISAYPLIEAYQFLGSGLLTQMFLALAVAGVIAAAMSSADTVIIAFIARILTFFPSIYVSLRSLGSLRMASLLVTLLVVLLSWITFVTQPDIVSLIFALFPAQLFFFGYFFIYITSGGNVSMTGRVSTMTICYFCCLFLAVTVNIFPFVLPEIFQPTASLSAVFNPVLFAVLGFFVAKNQLTHQKKEF